MPAHYEISDDGKSIKCLLCGMTSQNPTDVGMRYCGNCHQWIGELVCDFCLGEYPIEKDYRAVSQIVGQLQDARFITDRDMLWAACAECSRLIETEKWDALLERAIVACDAKWGPERAGASLTRDKLIFCYQGVFGDRFKLENKT